MLGLVSSSVSEDRLTDLSTLEQSVVFVMIDWTYLER